MKGLNGTMLNSLSRNNKTQITNKLQTHEYLNKNKITNKRISTIIHTQIDKNIKINNTIPYDNVIALLVSSFFMWQIWRYYCQLLLIN